jgi:exodeoxyribonuclease VII small subunit
MAARPPPQAPPKDDAAAPPSFEVALAQLEEVVGRLEKGDLPLEESLRAYEAGVRLVQQAKGRLDDMSARLEILQQDGTTRPLDDAGDDNRGQGGAKR